MSYSHCFDRTTKMVQKVIAKNLKVRDRRLLNQASLALFVLLMALVLYVKLNQEGDNLKQINIEVMSQVLLLNSGLNRFHLY